MSDEEILKLSYSKPSLFNEIFDRYNKRFMKVAKKTLRSSADAEDAVQETFIRIYKYGQKFPERGGKFGPWASKIFKNCLTDQINKYKKTSFELTPEMENSIPDLNSYNNLGNGIFAEKSLTQFVLEKIDGTTAEILNLRFVLGKSFKEIAKTLNIKSGAARVRVYRSKKLFIQAYELLNKYEY